MYKIVITVFSLAFALNLNMIEYPLKNIGIHSNDDSLQLVSSVQCPNVSSSDFATLGPPDIPHKIRVIYAYSDEFPVVSWESNDPSTTILDQDIGNFGAYFQENGYNFVNIKLTIQDGANHCTSTHILGWPQYWLDD